MAHNKNGCCLSKGASCSFLLDTGAPWAVTLDMKNSTAIHYKVGEQTAFKTLVVLALDLALDGFAHVVAELA